VYSVVFFLLGDSPASEFYIPTFRNTLSSIFIGVVSRKDVYIYCLCAVLYVAVPAHILQDQNLFVNVSRNRRVARKR